METVVWPRGTWTVFVELMGGGSFPEVIGNAPLTGGPRDLMPERYGDRGRPWLIQARPEPGLADEVVNYCVGHALPIARASLDVEVALRALTEEQPHWESLPRVWALIYACGMLEHAHHPALGQTAAELHRVWVADPRPDFLEPVLQRWLA
jgi:hypothetical protein